MRSVVDGSMYSANADAAAKGECKYITGRRKRTAHHCPDHAPELGGTTHVHPPSETFLWISRARRVAHENEASRSQNYLFQNGVARPFHRRLELRVPNVAELRPY